MVCRSDKCPVYTRSFSFPICIILDTPQVINPAMIKAKTKTMGNINDAIIVQNISFTFLSIKKVVDFARKKKEPCRTPSFLNKVDVSIE